MLTRRQRPIQHAAPALKHVCAAVLPFSHKKNRGGATAVARTPSESLEEPPLPFVAHPDFFEVGDHLLAGERRRRHLGTDAQTHRAALGLALDLVHLGAGPGAAAAEAAGVAVALDNGAEAGLRQVPGVLEVAADQVGPARFGPLGDDGLGGLRAETGAAGQPERGGQQGGAARRGRQTGM